MERRLGLIGPSQSAHGQASWGSEGNAPGKIFLACFCVEKRNFVIRVLLCVVAVFLRDRKTVAALCTFSLIIVKSLQLRGRRQIAESRKYYLVHVFSLFFFLFFFVSHRLGF